MEIHSGKDNISDYQYCTSCRYSVLYGKFGAGFRKGFCFSEFGWGKIRQNASPYIDCVAFVLMSLHMGLHLTPLINKLKKNKKLLRAGQILAVLLAAFGVTVFIGRAFYEELFYHTEFKFFDTDKSAVLYFFETMAMSFPFAFIAYYGRKLLQMKKNKNENSRWCYE